MTEGKFPQALISNRPLVYNLTLTQDKLSRFSERLRHFLIDSLPSIPPEAIWISDERIALEVPYSNK